MTDLPAPRFEYRDGFLLAGLRRVHRPESASETIPAQWRDFEALDLKPAMNRRRYGVMCGLTDAGFEYMTAVEVASFNDLPEDAGRMRVPAQRYAIFQDEELSTGNLWMAIFRWLEGGPFRSAHQPDFELYDADSASPELWVGVVPAGAEYS